jgi:hypothetical protein
MTPDTLFDFFIIAIILKLAVSAFQTLADAKEGKQ